jgi:hypothetical protein
VIAAVVLGVQPTFDQSDVTVQYRQTPLVDMPCCFRPTRQTWSREVPRHIDLIVRENVDREASGTNEVLVRARAMRHANQDKWWLERDCAESICGQALQRSGLVQGCHNRNAGRE